MTKVSEEADEIDLMLFRALSKVEALVTSSRGTAKKDWYQAELGIRSARRYVRSFMTEADLKATS